MKFLFYAFLFINASVLFIASASAKNDLISQKKLNVINHELNCLSKNANSVNWSNICYSDNIILSKYKERDYLINEFLNKEEKQINYQKSKVKKPKEKLVHKKNILRTEFIKNNMTLTEESKKKSLISL